MTAEQFLLDGFLTTQQTAELFHMNKQTLAKWRCNKSEGPPWHKISGKILYRISDLEIYIENSKQH